MIIVFVLWYWHKLPWDSWNPIQLPRFHWFHTYCDYLKSWGWFKLYEKYQSEPNLPIFQGVTVSQNSPSVLWGPSCFIKMTVGTLCTLALCQDKVFALADCPYPNIEDVAVSSTHIFSQSRAQVPSFPLSIHWQIGFSAYLCIQKALVFIHKWHTEKHMHIKHSDYLVNVQQLFLWLIEIHKFFTGIKKILWPKFTKIRMLFLLKK